MTGDSQLSSGSINLTVGYSIRGRAGNITLAAGLAALSQTDGGSISMIGGQGSGLYSNGGNVFIKAGASSTGNYLPTCTVQYSTVD